MSARGISAAVITGLLSLAGPHADEPPGVVSVRIGWGCIDVPASYRVVDKPTSIIDQGYGYIIAPDQPEVEWMFGPSQAHPYCHKHCRTIWRRKEILGGHEREVGLLQDAGVKAFFVVDEWISFRANADKQGTLDYLRNLVAGYQRRKDPERCLGRESP